MSQQQPEPSAETTSEKGETPWQRRKRMAEVFGDVLPDATKDERGGRSGKSDDWYRDQVPPHHG